MLITFVTGRSLPFEEGDVKYRYAELAYETSTNDDKVIVYGNSDDISIPIWGDDVYQEDIEEIKKIAMNKKVKVVVSIPIGNFRDFLREDRESATMLVTECDTILYYRIVGQDGCCLLISEE